MSITHGKEIHFQWVIEGNRLKISNQRGYEHIYHLEEIHKILNWLKREFKGNWFPLANNVAKLGRGTELPGLGTAILELTPGDITHAQGASYLGVVLDEVEIFSWNGAKRGIKWRIIHNVKDVQELQGILSEASGKN